MPELQTQLTVRKRTGKKVTEDEFNVFQKLFEAGLNNRQIRELTGRSTFTLNYARKSKNYEDYQAQLREYNEKFLKKNKKITSNKATNGEPEERTYPELGKLLESIDARLKKIVEIEERRDVVAKLEKNGHLKVK